MIPDAVAMCNVDLERMSVKDSGFFVDCNGPNEANNISQTMSRTTRYQSIGRDIQSYAPLSGLKLDLCHRYLDGGQHTEIYYGLRLWLI